jgi:23S rRNA (cytidine1920-2'-O)/16S rRNA (cytidine1409-2'-O)-methyltransferase
MAKRSRLDTLLAERGTFTSRTAAAKAIRAGQVKLGKDGQIALRPSQEVALDQEIEVLEGQRYVSRGGIKLENGLDRLEIDPSGKLCLDVGASTGGFTDCLLQRGARHVISLDVAYGQIDASMRDRPEVTVIERLNARDLLPADLEYRPDLAVIDVSFISLTKVLPAVANVMAAESTILAMVKPQFELGRARVGRGGVVRSQDDRREAVETVADFALSLGLSLDGIAPTGLPGPKGNLETFIQLGHSKDSGAKSGPSPREGSPGRARGADSGAALCEGVEL